MKKHLLPALLLALAPALYAEGPADDVKAAAKKLAEGGYTWTTSSPGRDGGPGMSAEGKADKSGVVCLKNTFGDRTTETIIKAGKAAVKTEDGWKSGAELAAASQEGGGGRGRGFGSFAARMAENYKAPAAEVEALVGGVKELKQDGDAISGDLSEEAAKERLTFGGRGRRPGGDNSGGAPPAPTNAKGTVKFWLKDGALAKYELTLSGTRERNGESDDFTRTSTIEFKDVGTTKLEIPAEASAKLEGDSGKKEENKDAPKEKPAKSDA